MEAWGRGAGRRTVDDVDEAVRRVLSAPDARTALEAATDVACLLPDSEPAHWCWRDLADVDEPDEVGDVPPDHALVVLRSIASRWLRSDPEQRLALAEHVLDSTADELLASHGLARAPWPDPLLAEPWRGLWRGIERQRASVDTTGSPYMAGIGVLGELDAADRDPVLWEAARGEELVALLAQWRSAPARRDEVAGRLAELLGSLEAAAVPPLRPHG